MWQNTLQWTQFNHKKHDLTKNILNVKNGFANGVSNILRIEMKRPQNSFEVCAFI